MLQSGLLWAAALGVCVTGCGATQLARNECRLAALEGFPEDPREVTFYAGADLAERLEACKAPVSGPDAGKP